MKILDFSGAAKELGGKCILKTNGEVMTLSEYIGNALVSGVEGDALKLFSIASTISEKKKIEVDVADEKLIETTIKGSKTITNLIKGQALAIMAESKDKK